MPIYEYTCQKCNAHIEVLQKISDKPLKRHAECGGKLVKEWSQTSFQFKGSGWYVTDYAGKKQDGKESKETKSDSASTGGEKEAKKSDTSKANASPTTSGD